MLSPLDTGPLMGDRSWNNTMKRLVLACAVIRRRFSVGANPTRRTLQPEATGAVMEVTKWLKPSGKASHDLVAARVCRPQRE